MDLTWAEIYDNAVKFSKRWENAKNERAEAQVFLHEFLAVFGVDSKRVSTFEEFVHPTTDSYGFIDLLWKGRILVEMKSRGKSLIKAYDQARKYAFSIKSDEDLPEYVMVCDFDRIVLTRETTNQRWEFKVKDLKKNIKKFSILTIHATKYNFVVDKELNTAAAYKMAHLHDELEKSHYSGHQLQVYLVRLLFCLFADDAGIFPKDSFHQYILDSKSDGTDLSGRISSLFFVLDTPTKDRMTHLSDDLYTFPYVNGSLFREVLQPAAFSKKMRDLLLECCQFDWSAISPSIFGSMFQGVMDGEMRRSLGAHYTSEQNILKVIKPLFLDELYAEFERVKTNKVQLEHFHKKLAKLKFFDPAMGCGNFLVVVYRELRLLELEILKMQKNDPSQLMIGAVLTDMDVLVDVDQFYGVEIEEFPCEIAKVAMWLVDHLMNNLVTEHFGVPYTRLPLHDSAHIHHGNALRLDWENIISKNELSYILGNPPFIGFTYMSDEQKQDMELFTKSKSLDYVCAWYLKAADYITNTSIKVAFVSTNSISQGEPVATLWGDLLLKKGLDIIFAYRSFVWSNEAKGKAAVHCVIVGFCEKGLTKMKYIFDKGERFIARNINPYLVDAPNVIVKSINTPLCDVPLMHYGNKIIDDGNLIIEANEYADFVAREPQAVKYIRKFVGSREFINGLDRYILNLQDASPAELKQCPKVMERVNKVREFRLSGVAEAIRKKASTPTLFGQITNSDTDYLLVPRVSSQRRRYVPMGYVDKDTVASDAVQIIPKATIYHFGVLTSSVHMAWMRAVCGRLKSDYRYGKDVVYNTFPWPNSTLDQKAAIEAAAQNILDVRALYPDSCLADLYDPLTMPHLLTKAHDKLDKEVEKSYGIKNQSEEEIVSRLMVLYDNISAPLLPVTRKRTRPKSSIQLKQNKISDI